MSIARPDWLLMACNTFIHTRFQPQGSPRQRLREFDLTAHPVHFCPENHYGVEVHRLHLRSLSNRYVGRPSVLVNTRRDLTGALV